MKKESIKKSLPIKILKFILTGLMSIVLIIILTFTAAGFIPVKSPVTTAGYKQNQSLYVTMKDGTKINVKVMLPYDLKRNF